MPSPMVAATLQAAFLSSISNLIAQVLGAYKNGKPILSSLNAVELLRFVLLTLITAPPNYKWQQLLERSFPGYKTNVPSTDSDIEIGATKRKDDAAEVKPKLSIRNTLIKWLLDCITLGALVNTIIFLILMGLMKGQTRVQIEGNIRTETLPIIVNGYKVWPIASIISFSFIPVERRIVFLSFIGLCWGVYMSFVAARV